MNKSDRLLELGPRTDRDIEQVMHREVEQDRFTGLDRRLLRAVKNDVIDLWHEPDQQYQRFNRNLMLGRLEKLRRMGMAQEVKGNVWRLSDSMESTLQRAGERGDIIKTMHAEMKRQDIEHAEADYAIYDPSANRPLTGRVVSKGLSDEMHDHTYLIVDGLDRPDALRRCRSRPRGWGVWYQCHRRDRAEVRGTEAVGPGCRGGRQSQRWHLQPRGAPASRRAGNGPLRASPCSAARGFAEGGHVARMPDGTWTIPEDYLDRATEYEAVRGRRQPVSVAVRSSWSLERQVTAEGATWLDQQLVTGDRPSLAVTGFGKAVEDALAHRRANLIEHGVARERGGAMWCTSGTSCAFWRRGN